MTEVRVWIARLEELSCGRLAQLRGHLDPAELGRSRRLRRDEDRDRFTATRGLLRELLGGELGRAPATIALTTGPAGKPQLAAGDRPGLRFNAAHSGSRSAFAIARDREVGIDVERRRERTEVDSLAPRVLSDLELTAWRDLDPPSRRAAFFATWARKEAYVKGLGVGLQRDLRRLHLEPPRPDGRVRVVDPGIPGWMVRDLDAGPGYFAAVAAQGDDWEVVLRRLDAGRAR